MTGPRVPVVDDDVRLKFLLVGDADVGKDEILNALRESPLLNVSIDARPGSIPPKTTTILLDGHRIHLQLWDTSGQGRFTTILRNHSRGAHGILLVYDITNKWSYGGIKRWLKLVDEHAPGLPRVLVGNRLHLEFNRRIARKDAETFAAKRKMEYFEVSALAGFNLHESLSELARLVLIRNNFYSTFRKQKVPSLQELASRVVAQNVTSVHCIDRLPIPVKIMSEVRSFTHGSQRASATLPLRSAPRRTRTPSGSAALMSARTLRRRLRHLSLHPLSRSTDGNDRCRIM